MHEYPITEQLIKIAEEHCEKAGAHKVTRINLVVGEYSGFVPESIHMYFDMISEGTKCEGAEIDITRVKAKLSVRRAEKYLRENSYLLHVPSVESMAAQQI